MAGTGREEQIRSRAYEIWDREGRQHGSHDDHWHRAAQEIAAEAGSASEDEDRTPDAGGTGTRAAVTAPGGGSMPVGGTAAAGTAALGTGMPGAAAPGNLGGAGGATGASPAGGRMPGVSGSGLAGSVTGAVGGGGLGQTRGTQVGASTPGAGSGAASQPSGAPGGAGTGSGSRKV